MGCEYCFLIVKLRKKTSIDTKIRAAGKEGRGNRGTAKDNLLLKIILTNYIIIKVFFSNYEPGD